MLIETFFAIGWGLYKEIKNASLIFTYLCIKVFTDAVCVRQVKKRDPAI